MAFLDDILGGPERLSIGEDGGDPIVVDASINEVHSLQGEVSDHPVESGVDIVDHYRVLPRGLQIEAVITNTPLSRGLPGTTLINSVIGLVEGDTDPVSNAWSELQRFFDAAVVVSISTSLQRYTNMVLTSLDVTRNAANGQVLGFSASAREVRFVDTQSGLALTLPATPVGQTTKSAGKKTNTEANAAETTRTSALLQTFQGLGLAS